MWLMSGSLSGNGDSDHVFPAAVLRSSSTLLPNVSLTLSSHANERRDAFRILLGHLRWCGSFVSGWGEVIRLVGINWSFARGTWIGSFAVEGYRID
jgi:hypothetical protein